MADTPTPEAPAYDNMFAVDGAEQLEADAEDAAEFYLEPDRLTIIVKEWTVQGLSATFPLPPHQRCLNDLVEWAENNLDPEGEYTDFVEATETPEVMKAFDDAMAVLAKHIYWRTADKHVKSWAVTFNEDSELVSEIEIPL